MTKEQFIRYIENEIDYLIDMEDDVLYDAKCSRTPIEFYNLKNQSIGISKCIKLLKMDLKNVDEIYDNLCNL